MLVGLVPSRTGAGVGSGSRSCRPSATLSRASCRRTTGVTSVPRAYANHHKGSPRGIANGRGLPTPRLERILSNLRLPASGSPRDAPAPERDGSRGLSGPRSRFMRGPEYATRLSVMFTRIMRTPAENSCIHLRNPAESERLGDRPRVVILGASEPASSRVLCVTACGSPLKLVYRVCRNEGGLEWAPILPIRPILTTRSVG